MPIRSLADFVSVLRAAGELAVVEAAVDPYLEISEITDRVVKAGGPALLFSRVTGSAFPVLTNAFGSERRMALALGADSLAGVEARIRKAIDLSVPDTLGGKLGKLLSLTTLASAIPRTVAAGPCQEVIEREPDLRTSPGAHDLAARRRPVRDLAAGHHQRPGERNAKRRDVSRSGLRPQHDGDALAAAQARPGACREMGPAQSPWPSTIGADPAITYAATAPLPPIVDEMALAGFLRGAPDRDGPLPNHRSQSARARRIRARRLCRQRGAADRRPLRRPHRGLQPRRLLPDLSRRMHHPPPRSDLRLRRSSANRRWKTPGSAKRRNGSFFRCCKWSCPRSSITTCPSRAGFTIWRSSRSVKVIPAKPRRS